MFVKAKENVKAKICIEKDAKRFAVKVSDTTMLNEEKRLVTKLTRRKETG